MEVKHGTLRKFRRELKEEDLVGLNSENASCIKRLASKSSSAFLSEIPMKNQAAVAAILFQGQDGQLRVVMTTRSLHLRSHPGQASLPGGKFDQVDDSFEETALRESVEEIGLEPDRVIWLMTSPPFLSKTAMLVHPVVFFMPVAEGSNELSRFKANPSEVDAIWSTPLVQFLFSKPLAEGAEQTLSFADPTLVDPHRPPQHALRTYSDLPWILGSYRLHRFRTTHQLVKGLTADILINVSAEAYGRRPAFRDRAPDQKTWPEMIEFVVQRYTEGKRGQKRWGDGESGDSNGTETLYETFEGTDDAEGQDCATVETTL
ncbi:hypothetical protein IE53DRAFT_378318 [Violaceomyces palustris]|uniref:Uncharacterized protein n=1 Tax=Violaceomyces palustris TaxID=1673888 RepID=A0ACD0P2K3_9BASI|nr:hypothetical protein IE53DRAFT_378318 [Violaceomyces palustris]